jgi:hypothetical protein
MSGPRGSLLALVAASLCTGCGNELPLEAENRVGYADDHVGLTCDGYYAATPARLRRARQGLEVILAQYGKTPRGAAQIVESDDPEPLSRIIDGYAHPGVPWWPECRQLSRRAQAALLLGRALRMLPVSGGYPGRPLGVARPPKLTKPTTTRESFSTGVVRRVPLVGTLTWSCDRHARQFFTRLSLARPGATVFIRLNSDGSRLYDHKQVDPAPPPARTTITAPLATRGQSWRIRYHHEPATILVTAHVHLASRSGPKCVTWRTAVHRRPH